MRIIPDEIKEVFLENNVRERTKRNWRLRFLDQDGEEQLIIDNKRILTESLTITEGLCESDDLVFGDCNAAQIEVTVADIQQDLTGKEFIATCEINGYEMAMGVYTIENFVRQADRRLKKITAYDNMRKFNVDVSVWYKNLTFPINLKQFRASLCDYIGVEQIDTDLPLDDMQIAKTIDPEQLNGLDVLKNICEINGCFGHMSKDGYLQYIFLENDGLLYPSETLFPSEDLFLPDENDSDNQEEILHYKQSETTYEDYTTVSIDRLQIRQEDGDVGVLYGDGSNTYVIEGNFLVYGKSSEELTQIATEIYEKISERSYRPCKIVTRAIPWIEVGDRITCYTTDDVIETYCLKRTMTGIQNTMDQFEASGSIEYEENFGIQSQIIQLEGKAAVIKKSVEEVSVALTDFKADTEAKFKITSDSISAEVKRAQEAESSLNIGIQSISLSVKDLTSNTSSEIKALSNRIDLKVSKGDVSSQLSVESGGVTIKGNRLTIDSNNFKLSADGTVNCTNGIFTGRVEASEGKIGGFTIQSDGSIKTSSGASIDFGDIAYIDSSSANIASWEFDDDGNLQGPLVTSDSSAQYWDSDGNLHATEIYIHDSWWKGWSVTETVKQLWEYVYNGGWNPCKGDSCKCDGSHCLCDSSSGTTSDQPCVSDGECSSDIGCNCDDNSPGCSSDSCGGDYPCSGDCGCYGPADS